MSFSENQSVRIEALKPDGHCYRHWSAELLLSSPYGCVVQTPPGTEVFCGDELGWVQEYDIRSFFSYRQPVNVLEVLDPDGTPVEIYANIASLTKQSAQGLSYIDYELDVVKDLKTPGRPKLIDKDELAEAVKTYALSDELVSDIEHVGSVVIELVSDWCFGQDSSISLEYLEQFMSQKTSRLKQL